MGLSPKKNQGSLEKQLISELEQGKYKMNLENLGSDSREVLKKWEGHMPEEVRN